MIAPRSTNPTRECAAGRQMSLLAEGVERYCADSLDLAKLELGQGAASMAGNLARLSLFALIFGTGYALLSAALALALAAWLGTAWAFLAVGALNALSGAIGLKLVADRMLATSRRLLEPQAFEVAS